MLFIATGKPVSPFTQAIRTPTTPRFRSSLVPRDEKPEMESKLKVDLIDKEYKRLSVALLFTVFNQNNAPKTP